MDIIIGGREWVRMILSRKQLYNFSMKNKRTVQNPRFQYHNLLLIGLPVWKLEKLYNKKLYYHHFN